MKSNKILFHHGTLRVIETLLNGKTTPTTLAHEMKIRPPSAIDHLRRLQKFGLVKLGRKEGKKQHYDLDLQRLSDLFEDDIATLTSLKERAMK